MRYRLFNASFVCVILTLFTACMSETTKQTVVAEDPSNIIVGSADQSGRGAFRFVIPDNYIDCRDVRNTDQAGLAYVITRDQKKYRLGHEDGEYLRLQQHSLCAPKTTVLMVIIRFPQFDYSFDELDNANREKMMIEYLDNYEVLKRIPAQELERTVYTENEEITVGRLTNYGYDSSYAFELFSVLGNHKEIYLFLGFCTEENRFNLVDDLQIMTRQLELY